jgi:hypothetical protein
VLYTHDGIGYICLFWTKRSIRIAGTITGIRVKTMKKNTKSKSIIALVLLFVIIVGCIVAAAIYEAPPAVPVLPPIPETSLEDSIDEPTLEEQIHKESARVDVLSAEIEFNISVLNKKFELMEIIDEVTDNRIYSLQKKVESYEKRIFELEEKLSNLKSHLETQGIESEKATSP